MVKAINCLSESGIVHCDIKPANILYYTRDYRQSVYKLSINILTELTDFGVAMQSGEHSASGTLRFIPPEIHAEKRKESKAKNVPRYPSSDIFALGMTLMDVYFSGHFEKDKYFTSKNPNQLLRQEVDGRHPEISIVQKAVFTSFVTRCLNPRPFDRITPKEALRHQFIRID